jgi:glycosyltransferase involved in cell wall biosynthesis
MFFRQKPLPQQLNICLVGARFPVLGRQARESFLFPVARSLARKGHKVTILSWQNPQNREYVEGGPNISAYFLGYGSRANRRDFPRLVEKKFLELHAKEPFHVVHGLDASALLIGRNKKQYGVNVTYDVSAIHMSEIFSILGMAKESVGSLLQTAVAVSYKFLTTYWGKDRALLATADAVFVTTPLQMIALERYYLYPELKTFLIPYGSELVDLVPREKPEEFRQRLGVPSNASTIVTITDMNELEEISPLLKAFARVVIKKPSSRLIIVGNGPRFKDIEYEMLNLALGSKVILTGAVGADDIHDYLALSDILVNLSSRTTGFEPSMLEAMAFKKVVVGSELSPMSTTIENGIDGFLVRPADVGELTDLLTQIISDRLPVAEIGEKARKKVLELFDTDRMTEKMLAAFYQTLRDLGRAPKFRLEGSDKLPTI